MSGSPTRQKVLYVEAKSDFRPQIENWTAGLSHFELVPSPDLATIVEKTPADLKPALILLDGRQEAQHTLEWAQNLKMTFSCPMIIFYDGHTKLNFSVLKKNGADSLLHFYFDAEFVIDKILELVPWDEDGPPPLSVLNPISFEDLTTEMDLNFDLYVHLPGNQKSILVRKKGAALEQRLMDKAKDMHQNLYFKKTELKQFLEYSRTALSLKNSDLTMSVTDKTLKARTRIQQIISGFFDQESGDYAQGKVIFDNCVEIVQEFGINTWKDKAQAIESVVIFSGRPRTYYNDAITMCVVSAAFGYLLDKPTPEVVDLAIAGLLHNIGLASMDQPQLGPDISKLEKPVQDAYLAYPASSVNQVKNKRVPLSPRVTNLILQHRETVSGGGFPKGSSAEQQEPLARVIQLAFIFMELTQLQNNKPRHTLQGAFQFMNDEALSGGIKLDLATLISLKKAFGVKG